MENGFAWSDDMTLMASAVEILKAQTPIELEAEMAVINTIAVKDTVTQVVDVGNRWYPSYLYQWTRVIPESGIGRPIVAYF